MGFPKNQNRPLSLWPIITFKMCSYSIIIFLGSIVLCHPNCVYPWIEPKIGQDCYAMSNDKVNYYEADRVGIDKSKSTKNKFFVLPAIHMT